MFDLEDYEFIFKLHMLRHVLNVKQTEKRMYSTLENELKDNIVKQIGWENVKSFYI